MWLEKKFDGLWYKLGLGFEVRIVCVLWVRSSRRDVGRRVIKVLEAFSRGIWGGYG